MAECQSCRYWSRHNDTYARGSCYRYPPSSPHSEFPVTLETMWCGEYRQEDEPDKIIAEAAARDSGRPEKETDE